VPNTGVLSETDGLVVMGGQQSAPLHNPGHIQSKEKKWIHPSITPRRRDRIQNAHLGCRLNILDCRGGERRVGSGTAKRISSLIV